MGVGWAHIGHQERNGFPVAASHSGIPSARALQETWRIVWPLTGPRGKQRPPTVILKKMSCSDHLVGLHPTAISQKRPR